MLRPIHRSEIFRERFPYRHRNNVEPPTLNSADDPRSVIVEFARRLNVKNFLLRQLGIQFVQMGYDPNATEALKELDEQLRPANGDMVDTTPVLALFSKAQPSLRADLIVQIVLGAINSAIDHASGKVP